MRHPHEPPEMVEIACHLVHETDAASLIYDGTKEVWVPKSQTTLEWNGLQNCYILSVPQWLAEKNGLV